MAEVTERKTLVAGTWTDADEAAVASSDSEREDEASEAASEARHKAEGGGDDDDEDDEEDEDEKPETEHSHKARKLSHEWVDVHAALFRITDTYRFQRQLTRHSPHVYVVRDADGTECVLKLTPYSPTDFRRPTQAPKEVRILHRLRGVPHVLPLLRWHRVNDEYYCTLHPLCVDDDFEALFGQPALIRTYFRQLLQTLEACEARGVFNRDVKSSNIYWDRQQQNVVLGDWDLACLHPHRRRTHCVGTETFSSPQVEQGTGYTCKADAYSCGVLLGMALYGIHENDVNDDDVAGWQKLRGNAKAKRKKLQKRSQSAAPKTSVDPAARELLEALLEKDEARRPSFAEALRFRYFSAA